MDQTVLLAQSTLREVKRWQLATFMAIAIIILLSLVILAMMPLKTTEVKYVEFSESGKHNFKIIKSPLSKKQKVLLIRQVLREYVKNRISYTGNHNIDTATVSKVVAMYNSEVINQFREVYNIIDKKTTIERREVFIISDIPLGKNAHQVQYKTIDHHQGKTYDNQWVSTISYSINNQIVTQENELLNPLGITVDGFFESKKKFSEEELNNIIK